MATAGTAAAVTKTPHPRQGGEMVFTGKTAKGHPSSKTQGGGMAAETAHASSFITLGNGSNCRNPNRGTFRRSVCRDRAGRARRNSTLPKL